MKRKRKLTRPQIEGIIQCLFDMLDELDGDPDREANGDDEPSLGWLAKPGGTAGFTETTTAS